MDVDTLEAVMVDPAVPRSLQPSRAVYEAWCAPFNDAMVQAGITTVSGAAMWCAQIGHECVGLKYAREIWGPTATQKRYEGRLDLGNTQPGDGYRYLGRGVLQITGRHNYTELSRWAYQHGYVPTETWLVDYPELLEQPKYGLLGAVWYWTVQRPQLNSLADAGEILAVSVAINGRNRATGLPNGWDDRKARYARALALGARLLPGSVQWVDLESTLPVLREGDGYPPAPVIVVPDPPTDVWWIKDPPLLPSDPRVAPPPVPVDVQVSVDNGETWHPTPPPAAPVPVVPGFLARLIDLIVRWLR